jgi:hypothetical protein
VTLLISPSVEIIKQEKEDLMDHIKSVIIPAMVFIFCAVAMWAEENHSGDSRSVTDGDQIFSE